MGWAEENRVRDAPRGALRSQRAWRVAETIAALCKPTKGGDSYWWGGIETLATKTHTSRSTIDRGLRELREVGFLQRVEGEKKEQVIIEALYTGAVTPDAHTDGPGSQVDAGDASRLTQGCVTSDAHMEKMESDNSPYGAALFFEEARPEGKCDRCHGEGYVFVEGKTNTVKPCQCRAQHR